MTSADDDFFTLQVTDGDLLRHNPSGVPPLQALIDARCSRRTAIAAAAVISAAAVSKPMPAAHAAPSSSDLAPSTLTFKELEHGYDGTAHVADGYDWKVLLRWGDPVLAGAPAFDPLNQTAAGQERQFGYNNDFIAFLPLPLGSQSSDHGLLCVNHEYTIANLMFPKDMPLAERSAIELAAHGHSVVEIRRTGHAWKVVSGSKHARRITALSTKMTIAGPAAGHPRLQTTADPSGKLVIGTLNNCAGGVTPWGTVLIAEENFPFYFAGLCSAQSERVNHRRYGVLPVSQYVWSKFYSRFDLSKEPREPNRFGWMVEFDPYDPKSIPVKRTALGRCRHEGATAVANHDGRVVLYSGDDSPFEYLYRFVSDKPYDAKARENNRDLLDHGVLSVAQFHDDGTLRWSPLVHGSGPLTDAAGFESQADVLIETRRAADLLKATPMDRPEDIEVSPRDGRVYVMLTNNSKRSKTDGPNPRPRNEQGQIVELIPPSVAGHADHTSAEFRWDILLLAGDPSNERDGAKYNPDVSENGWLSCPDNGAFDRGGRLWIATDGLPHTKKTADGLYACETTGPGRALTRLFFNAPRGAEVTGPCFTPDGETLFVSVQHPADEDKSSFASPSTRWPDFDDALPPRPSVLVITKRDGGVIGT